MIQKSVIHCFFKKDGSALSENRQVRIKNQNHRGIYEKNNDRNGCRSAARIRCQLAFRKTGQQSVFSLGGNDHPGNGRRRIASVGDMGLPHYFPARQSGIAFRCTHPLSQSGSSGIEHADPTVRAAAVGKQHERRRHQAVVPYIRRGLRQRLRLCPRPHRSAGRRT